MGLDYTFEYLTLTVLVLGCFLVLAIGAWKDRRNYKRVLDENWDLQAKNRRLRQENYDLTYKVNTLELTVSLVQKSREATTSQSILKPATPPRVVVKEDVNLSFKVSSMKTPDSSQVSSDYSSFDSCDSSSSSCDSSGCCSD